MNRICLIALIVLGACRPAPDETPTGRPMVASSVRWLSPDSSPQLQAYQYAWPPEVALAPLCSAENVVIDADSIGPLRIGQRLPAILAACPRPLVGWDWGSEAIPSPALMVRFGNGTVLLNLTDTSDTATVYYLSTTDSALHTSDGVRIGQTVEALNAQIGPLEFGEGECELFAGSKRRPHLGIQLSLPTDSADCGNLQPTPPALPKGSVIAKLIVHGGT